MIVHKLQSTDNSLLCTSRHFTDRQWQNLGNCSLDRYIARLFGLIVLSQGVFARAPHEGLLRRSQSRFGGATPNRLQVLCFSLKNGSSYKTFGRLFWRSRSQGGALPNRPLYFSLFQMFPFLLLYQSEKVVSYATGVQVEPLKVTHGHSVLEQQMTLINQVSYSQQTFDCRGLPCIMNTTQAPIITMNSCQ